VSTGAERTARPAPEPVGAGEDGALVINLASAVEATEAEGPGLRFALWVQGCTIRCPGCCNPHLFHARPNQLVTVDALAARILAARARHPDLEGITLLGGEPSEQDAPLAALARRVRAAGLTVMTFTGRLREELEARGSPLVGASDILVDGQYVEALRTTTRRFVGSTNQRMHFLTEAYRADDPRFALPNHAELRLNAQGEVQVVGFPFDAFLAEFRDRRGGP
jgi:anaerobic ribonucleoside-triphosphate reductase activating protein